MTDISREHYRTIFDKGPDGCLVVEGGDGRILPTRP